MVGVKDWTGNVVVGFTWVKLLGGVFSLIFKFWLICKNGK